MLHGTCLGEALQTLYNNLGISIDDEDGEDDFDEFSGPDGNGEDGCDLDADDSDGGGGGGDDGNNGSPGPVDGPSNFSEVILAQMKGNPIMPTKTLADPSVQPRSTLAVHSKRLGNMLVKQTSMTSSEFFSFMNRTQHLLGPLHSLSALPQTMLRGYLSSTQ